MAVSNTPSKHVLQVAKLVKLLNHDEIQQLVKLVPQLQSEQQTVAAQQVAVVQWAKEQMAQYQSSAEPMQKTDLFLNNMSAEEYFNLPEIERERIWNKLYTTAIETIEECEVKPGAVVSAG